jgi:hypothetical protein
MLLQNNSRRLITLNSLDAEPINLMPAGTPMDVPEKLAKSKFVQALLKSRDIIIAEGITIEHDDGDEASDSPYAGMDKKELKATAEAMGITVTSKMTAKDIIATLDELEA